MAAVTVILPT